MKESGFSHFHPLAETTYFLLITVFAMFAANPVIVLSAMFGSALFCFLCGTRKGRAGDILFYLPLLLLITATNPLFSHNGVTPLFFLNGNPMTLEAFVYGLAIGVMLVGIMLWCKAFGNDMTGEKFVYLFSRPFSKLGMLLSMTFRFIPLFKKRIKEVDAAQKAMGLYTEKGFVSRLQGAMRVCSAVITISLENAVETGLSMKARGYGERKRSCFSLFRFRFSDFALIAASSVGMMVCAVLYSFGAEYYYYPSLEPLPLNAENIMLYIIFGALCLFPSIYEIREKCLWRYLKSKI